MGTMMGKPHVSWLGVAGVDRCVVAQPAKVKRLASPSGKRIARRFMNAIEGRVLMATTRFVLKDLSRNVAAMVVFSWP
jgi:hypothetical protein